MMRMAVSVLTLCAFVNCLMGCSSTVVMPRDKLLKTHREDDTILDARLRSDSVVYFNRWEVSFDSTARTLTGTSHDRLPIVLNYDEISAFRVERKSNTETVIMIVGLVGLGVGLALIIKNTCWGGFCSDDDDWLGDLKE